MRGLLHQILTFSSKLFSDWIVTTLLAAGLAAQHVDIWSSLSSDCLHQTVIITSTVTTVVVLVASSDIDILLFMLCLVSNSIVSRRESLDSRWSFLSRRCIHQSHRVHTPVSLCMLSSLKCSLRSVISVVSRRPGSEDRLLSF